MPDTAYAVSLFVYVSHHPDAERDVAWLMEQLAERDACIAELEARLRPEGVDALTALNRLGAL